MNRFLLCFLLVGIVLGNSCSYTNSGGDTWDLSPLTYDYTAPAIPAGYAMQGNDGNVYYINFCAPVVETLTDCITNPASGSCQLSGGNYHPSGTVSTLKWIPFVPYGGYTEGIGIVYQNGEFCSNNGEYRTTTIYVACDTSGDNEGLFYASSVFCKYTLYFKSRYGCAIVPTISPTPTPTPSPSISPSRQNPVSISCEYTNSNNTYWNLSLIAYDPEGPIPSEYFLYDRWVNFCAPIGQPAGYQGCNSGGDSGTCHYDYPNYNSEGRIDTATFTEFIPYGNYTNGIGLNYSNGYDGVNSTVNVACDILAGTGELYDIHYRNSNHIYYEFKSIYGCGIPL